MKTLGENSRYIKGKEAEVEKYSTMFKGQQEETIDCF